MPTFLRPGNGQGEGAMDPTVDNVADMSFDVSELLLETAGESHIELMAEQKGNSAAAHSIVRFSAARKFNQEDPIEAAAAEMILQPNV